MKKETHTKDKKLQQINENLVNIDSTYKPTKHEQLTIITSEIISKYDQLSNFFQDNPDLRPYVRLSELNTAQNGSGIQRLKYQTSLRSTHENIKSDILEQISKVEHQISFLLKQIGQTSLNFNMNDLKNQIKKSIIFNSFEYDNITDIYSFRKLVFIAQKRKITEAKIIYRRLTILNDICNQLKRMHSIFRLQVMNFVKLQIDVSFFDIHFGGVLNTYLRRLEFYKSCENHLSVKCSQIPKAQWAFSPNNNDSNFASFLDSMLTEMSRNIDPDLSYCKPSPWEISLSRCFFHPFSHFKNEIDHFLDSNFHDKSPSSFVFELISFCSQFLEQFCPSDHTRNPNYQSVGLLIFFRVFFERCYEKNSSFFENDGFYLFEDSAVEDSEGEIKKSISSSSFLESLHITAKQKCIILKKIDESRSKPSNTFLIPPKLVRNFLAENQDQPTKALVLNPPNSETNDDPDSIVVTIDDPIPIHDLLYYDEKFRKASDSFDCAVFVANPIDCLYEINNALLLVHQAAIANRIQNEIKEKQKKGELITQAESAQFNYRPNDPKRLLSFDELFSLFFGTLMASNVIDIFELIGFIDSYAPKNCLSPSFEYAQASLQALVLHCTSMGKQSS